MKTKYDSMCHYDFASHLMPQLEAWSEAKIKKALETCEVTLLPRMHKGKAGVKIWADTADTDHKLNSFRSFESIFQYYLNGEESWSTKKKLVRQLETITKKLKQEIAAQQEQLA